MRPVEFTSEEIIKAGQELRAAGRNITGFALRQKIGGGSPARLKQVWDEHLQAHAPRPALPFRRERLAAAEAQPVSQGAGRELHARDFVADVGHQTGAVAPVSREFFHREKASLRQRRVEARAAMALA